MLDIVTHIIPFNQKPIVQGGIIINEDTELRRITWSLSDVRP